MSDQDTFASPVTRKREPFIDAPLACEDFGESIDIGRRRIRCKHCGKLVCGWCYNHVHGLAMVEEAPDGKGK